VTWGFSPLDRELGLLPHTQLLPLLSETVVRLGAWMPFARVAEFLRETSRTTCGKASVQRQTLEAGAALVEAETKATTWLLEKPRESDAPIVDHQQISVDGAMVPLVGRWAEVKTVAIGTVVATADGPKATDLSYFSRLSDHTTFTQQATLELHRRATHRAGQVTAVVDGADWIQTFLDLHCPEATRIIDWAHSSSYLNSAAQALFPNPGEAADWRSKQLNALMHGEAQEVLDELCRQLGRCPLNSPAEEQVRTCLGYLARRLDYVAYRRFRAAGLPIGSGIVESGNKLVVAARLKGAGMRWAEQSVDPMLALRNAICSVAPWQRSWNVLGAYRAKVARERAIAAHDRRHPPPAPPPKRKRRRTFRDFSLTAPSRRPTKP
jgi:hypothetical protein